LIASATLPTSPEENPLSRIRRAAVGQSFVTKSPCAPPTARRKWSLENGRCKRSWSAAASWSTGLDFEESQLEISFFTVRFHVGNLHRKMRVQNSCQAVAQIF
jgi:hypothetical protein